MDFLAFSLSGLDEFLSYFGLSLLFVALFVAIYVHVTPYHEFALIREGNAAAAASLSGTLLGFILPLAASIVNSVHPYDMAIWAGIALVTQLAVYGAVRLVIPDIGRHIPEGKAASGIFLGAVSLGAGMLNAASMTY